MPIRMNKPGQSSFGINIEDTFDPTEDHTVELVDMDEFQGVSKIDGKPYTSIVWKFVIYDANGIAFTNLIDGGAFETWQFSSLSLASKSQGRAWASGLIGHELSDEECDKLADNFDGALVGKRALASWKVEADKATGNKRLKIALLRPLRKQRTAAPARPADGPTDEPVAYQPAAPSFVTDTRRPADVPERVTATPNGASRQTAAERRAQLEAELAAMTTEDDVDQAESDDVPF